MPLFYRPTDGVLADVIPFHWNGEWHLFYLKDYRDRPTHGEGTPWFHLVTRDFLDFEDRGEAIPRGEAGTQDQWIFTGCVIEHAGTFHIFYTGHQDHYGHTPKPVQAVMHATSTDLDTWHKERGFQLFAPREAGYEKDDWRDPFVFWNEEAGEFWMLLAARRTTGAPRARGCIALMASPDLKEWTLRDPLWQPGLFHAHECPDLFREKGLWYLLASVYSGATHTHARYAESLAGPWLRPRDELIDGRAWYAAKTASDGTYRFGFGWLPTREGDKDTGPWQWGGNLVVHEVTPRPNVPGELDASLPASIRAAFSVPHLFHPYVVDGDWEVGENFAADATGRHAVLRLDVTLTECLIETTILFEDEVGTPDFGLRLHWDEAADSYYDLRFEPALGRIVFDHWPQPFGRTSLLTERFFPLRTGQPLQIQLLLDGDCAVLYCNGRALSCRLHEKANGTLGLFATEGRVKFNDVRVWTRAQNL